MQRGFLPRQPVPGASQTRLPLRSSPTQLVRPSSHMTPQNSRRQARGGTSVGRPRRAASVQTNPAARLRRSGAASQVGGRSRGWCAVSRPRRNTFLVLRALVRPRRDGGMRDGVPLPPQGPLPASPPGASLPRARLSCVDSRLCGLDSPGHSATDCHATVTGSRGDDCLLRPS